MTPLNPIPRVPPRFPDEGTATPLRARNAIASGSTSCRRAGSVIHAVPLPPPRLAAPVYVRRTRASRLERFVSVSSDVKWEPLSPWTSRTTGTKTTASVVGVPPSWSTESGVAPTRRAPRRDEEPRFGATV